MSDPSFVPYQQRYLEDYTPNEVAEFGDYLVTEEEIVTFAKQYDPQIFHLDKEAAKASSFGGLVGSGWMTTGIMMRLMVLYFIPPCSSMGSPGVDEVRWLMPVFPGDRLSIRITVLTVTPSKTKPDRGVITFLTETLNQQKQVVMRVKGLGMNRTRAGAF
jgi:acyl dehydratase